MGEKQEAEAFTLPFIDYQITSLYSAFADAPLSLSRTLKSFLQVIGERKHWGQWSRGVTGGGLTFDQSIYSSVLPSPPLGICARQCFLIKCMGRVSIFLFTGIFCSWNLGTSQ